MPGGVLTKAQAEEMAPIGNSPTFLPLSVMQELMPLWANVSIAVFKDKAASEVRLPVWCWVLLVRVVCSRAQRGMRC